MIDFTNCQIDRTANYGGSDQKRGIIFQGERYMLKMADRISDSNGNSLNSSYSNSVYSENVCCEILKGSGFDVQETLLGFVTDKNGENKPAVACKNFVPEGYSLKDYINSLQNPDCTATLLRVYPQIDINVIRKIINDNPSISDVRKNFYSVMIQKRIERILEPAYEKVCSRTFSNGISNKTLENSKTAGKKPKFDMTDD